ncbi:MAG TPA: hypothetical protein PLH18_03405, partial [Clostridia bacterium]|nr:hypothetical protein [Clostridia bacterium]
PDGCEELSGISDGWRVGKVLSRFILSAAHDDNVKDKINDKQIIHLDMYFISIIIHYFCFLFIIIFMRFNLFSYFVTIFSIGIDKQTLTLLESQTILYTLIA